MSMRGKQHLREVNALKVISWAVMVHIPLVPALRR